MTADLARLAAGFGDRLRAEGLAVDPERCARFARAITLTDPTDTDTLFYCGLSTLTSDPAHLEVYARVFAAVFGTTPPPVDRPTIPSQVRPGPPAPPGTPAGPEVGDTTIATAAERLSTRDFATLTAAELASLAPLMRRLAVALPVRRSRRFVSAAHGPRFDLRATMRAARRTAGFPFVVARRQRRVTPRKLVVLCDISGSMEPYARAMLLLLYGAATVRADVFTFATRLTRLTRVLARTRPGQVLAVAGRTAPDWSGGTRIGESLREFNRRYGGRGAVVLILSDGWETGDAALLGREMARLSTVAHRIVWANPRAASAGYQPLVAGMAAAWPFCDAVVSAHSLAALDDLLTALAGPGRAPEPIVH